MRRLSLIVGLMVLTAAWLGPLPGLAREAFFAHMTMHMAVVAIAAPLMAFGLAGSRWDPVPHAAGLFTAIPASIGELIVVWSWHTPALHHAARHQVAALVAEQTMFAVAALWVWLAAVGGKGDTATRQGSGIAALLLTSMHMTLLGGLLALAPRPLYAHVLGWREMTPLEDQHLGGAIMLLVGGVSYLAGGLWLTQRLLTRVPEWKVQSRETIHS